MTASAQISLELRAMPVNTGRPVPEWRERLAAALPGPAAASIRWLFDCMEIAEEELRGLTPYPPGLFAALTPSAPLRWKGLPLYRAHVRELVARAGRGEPLEPGTDAECLAAVMHAAGDAPLRTEGQAVAEWLFARLFPERAAEIGCGEARERWAGQVAEDVAQLRRRLATPRCTP